MSMIKIKFSGHQTFVFRHGWLEKGVRLIQNNPHGFFDNDVLIKLGVGKNMVESIKYWCLQTQLLQEENTGVRSGNLELSDIAKYIFGDGELNTGVDPYLEDDSTLWLIHWFLMQNEIISTWQLVFSKLNKPEFTKAELLNLIQSWIQGIKNVSPATLNRDIDCFVRNYTGTRSKNTEENFDSPFLSLGLIQTTSEPDLYRFNIGAKYNLAAEIVGYAILQNMDKLNRTSLLVKNCIYEAGSPGQVFKLSEATLMDYLEELESKTNKMLMITDTAGMVSVVFSQGTVSPKQFADLLLNDYYGVEKTNEFE